MKYLNALNLISGVGPQKIRTLLAHFGNGENIWKSELSDLKTGGIPEKLAEKIILSRRNINPEKEWEKIQRENVKAINFDSPSYPILLKEIPNPPYLLYTKGDLDFFNFSPSISIVGSRKYTAYGCQVATALSQDLSQSGLTIVSGMALGIDSFSHKGALAKKGKTVAVLGNSLEDKNIYPRDNFLLSKEIEREGALISEYPIGTPAGPFTFPARNRLVAGMSLGTLVIEAGEKSGALITAQMALEFNREVFSVPGPIFSLASLGTNQLIKNGARTVTSAKDVLEEFSLDGISKKISSTPKIPENKIEEILLKILSTDPIHIDNIVKLSKLKTADVSSSVSIMEIKGWAKNIGGQNYIIT